VRDEFNYFEPEQWPTIQQFLADAMARFEKAINQPLAAAYKSLATASPETALADTSGTDESALE
jgi:hypothetical protein